jgi:hypothetical protein
MAYNSIRMSLSVSTAIVLTIILVVVAGIGTTRENPDDGCTPSHQKPASR